MNTRSRKTPLVLLLPLALTALPACGEAPELDASVEEAELVNIFDTCIGRGPDATLDRTRNDRVSSPTTYGTSACPKAWIVDLPAPEASADFHDVDVTWTDPWLRNQTQCVGGKLKIEVMTRGSGELVFRGEGRAEAALTWDAAQRKCVYSSASVSHYPAYDQISETWTLSTRPQEESISLRQYRWRRLRLVVSALTPAGSTQSVSVSTRPVHPDPSI